MATEGMGLSSVCDADLASLADAMDRGDLRPPFTPTSLQARGFGHLVAPLGPFLSLDGAGLRAIVEVAHAERRCRRPPTLTLVWTGDDPGISHSRHTRVVLPELFSKAREHVLVAGYSFDRPDLFRPLHEVMSSHGVTADFFVDIQQLIERLRPAAKAAGLSWEVLSAPFAAAREPRARGEAAVSLFVKLMWPFRQPRPRIYFDPRTATPFSAVSLHAKCVVVDHELSLITSANFTDRGQNRNFEAGVAIKDRAFAETLERQWRNLAQAGVVVANAD